MSQSELTDFATRYAAAWSSQDPVKFAEFYAEDGSLTVNDCAASVGRAAITATARGDQAIFHWTWTGTNTGPGGTGKSVHLSGYEGWTIGADGLIVESKGHYDEGEYQRQMSRQ